MNKLHSTPPATADVVRIERFRSESPHKAPPLEAVVLIFPLASQVDVVRRTACALLTANEHRRMLTFRLWRDGLHRQARRYGHSKRWATAQWIDFENAVRSEIALRGKETAGGAAAIVQPKFKVGDEVFIEGEQSKSYVIKTIDGDFAWLFSPIEGFETVEVSSLRRPGHHDASANPR